MTKGFRASWLVCVLIAAGMGGNAAAEEDDPFKGKLFPPDIILMHRAELNLTKQQFKDIRSAVVTIQSNVAAYEWDMAEAYQSLLLEIDRTPIDEAAALRHADVALTAENEVKKMQIAMLVQLRNLLTDEQVEYLETVAGK